MAYFKFFEYLKPKTTKITYLQKIANTNKKSAASKELTLGVLLKPYIKNYCDISTLNGFRYLTHPGMKNYEKFIWLLFILSTSIACAFVYYDLGDLYLTQRIQTTISDSSYPVVTERFPSIGVCHRYRINWQRLHNEAPKIFLPPNASKETLNTFYEFFEQMADLKFYTLKSLWPLFEGNSRLNLTLIDNLDVLKVMEYLTLDCHEAFEGNCRWRGKSFNCCDLFTLERTEIGFCYVFNTLIDPKMQSRALRDPFYPYHNSNAGEGTGLEMTLRINEELVDPNFDEVLGVYVMMKKSEQWYNEVKFVNYNTFTKVAISIQITETSSRIRSMPAEKRRCIYADEVNHRLYRKIPGLKYWRQNCKTRCHQEYVLKYCKCNLNLLFPTTEFDNFTACKASDFKCIYDNATTFSQESHMYEHDYIDDVSNESMACNCLNNCDQLLLDGFFNSLPLENVNPSDSMKFVRMDVYYQSIYLLKYRTSLRYTFVELLANFGGIMGFFLGASMLSVIELLYYFTIGLYAYISKQKMEHTFLEKSLLPRDRFKRVVMRTAKGIDID